MTMDAAISREEVFINEFVAKVFGWMAFALTVTGITAFLVSQSMDTVRMIVLNRPVFFGLMLVELGLVMMISWLINKISFTTAIVLFMTYSVVNGLTLSVIFLAYTMASIASTFLVTASTFGVMCAYGLVTKRDLTGIGSLLYMALFGLIIASIANFFLHNELVYWIITYAGVIIFVGLTAYDTQKIKRIGETSFAKTEKGQNLAVIGALSLYLDFINLFLFLLRLLGNRRR
ncbi:MAG: Bax inhibitor-1/YccA family protein [Planctomycetota bacterium]